MDAKEKTSFEYASIGNVYETAVNVPDGLSMDTLERAIEIIQEWETGPHSAAHQLAIQLFPLFSSDAKHQSKLAEVYTSVEKEMKDRAPDIPPLNITIAGFDSSLSPAEQEEQLIKRASELGYLLQKIAP